MLLRFQKAAVRGNYETGNQAFSKRLRFLTTRGHLATDRAPCPSSQSCPAVKSTTSQGSRQSRSAITWLPCLTCFGSGSEPCFAGFGRHRGLMLENLALRQQLAVFKRQQPRPRLGAIDKLFGVIARRFWAQWKKALLIVLPDTVARWHRFGFKLYWACSAKCENQWAVAAGSPSR